MRSCSILIQRVDARRIVLDVPGGNLCMDLCLLRKNCPHVAFDGPLRRSSALSAALVNKPPEFNASLVRSLFLSAMNTRLSVALFARHSFNSRTLPFAVCSISSASASSSSKPSARAATTSKYASPLSLDVATITTRGSLRRSSSFSSVMTTPPSLTGFDFDAPASSDAALGLGGREFEGAPTTECGCERECERFT